MNSDKEKLIKIIGEMSDEEAKDMLEFADQVVRYRNSSQTLRNLSRDPGIRMPSNLPGKFRKVKPATGKGIPTSKLLIKDRK